MGNNNQLEISLFLSRFGDLCKRLGEGFDIVSIKVGGGFVKGDELDSQIVTESSG